MNILILGSGGREHTFAWKISQSNKVDNLYVAPGNAGTADVAVNVDIAADDFDNLAAFALEKNIRIIVVGPEDPLVKGVSDYFTADQKLKHIAVIGPSQKGAELEGSKEFAKKFMERHQVPTARYKSFTTENLEEGYEFLDTLQAPYVLKADGLAAGKGVLILNDVEEAKQELKLMLDGKFGKAGNKVVIEEFLKGIELSVFVITDGEGYLILPEAKDYKRIGEGDTGLNTGGMGAVSPVPFADKAFLSKVEEQIVKPTVEGFKKDNIDYKGFIFIGLMNDNGNPNVVEYNVRMGDPETEVVFPRIENDLVEILEATANNKLSEITLQVKPEACTTVVMVSGGYPGTYPKGKVISGIENVSDSMVFHAGTKSDNGKTVTSGGRVLAVSSYGNNFKEALAKSYKSIEAINFDQMNFRKDIGFDL